MTKRHSTKQSLIASILVLCLCFTSLIGTTFAWFTDSVTSSGNKIVSGTLKVDLELLDKETSTWSSVKENNDPIFTYQNWEPGYVDAKVLKVENEGTLALKWKAKFTSADQLTDLANVIDVYVYAWGVLADASSVGYPADRALANYTRVGTLAEFVNTIESTTYGNLLAGESAYLGIALKMQEGAGNEYQDMDLGGAFDIQIVATQMASENDSFGPDYDEGAQFPGEAGSASELIEALSNNENVKLSGNIDLSEIAWTPIAEYSGILDGNGYAIKNLTGENGLFDKISGATIKNLTLENVNITATSYHTGAVAGYAIKNSEKQTVIENVTVSGTVNGGEYYTGGLLGADSNYDTVIKDCVNNATVVGGSNYTGGIVGYATRGSVITGCTNNGSVSGGSFVGGIVGFAAGDDTMANLSVVISDCVNTGKVEVTNTTVGWADCVGGIVGACGRVGGDSPVVMLNFYISDCTVVDGQKEYGRKYNVATGKDELITVSEVIVVSSVAELQAALDSAGSIVINFAADMDGDVIVNQPGDKDVNIVIDGCGYKYDGTISLKGNSSFNGAYDDDVVVIKNVNFETSNATSDNGRDAFVWSADSSNGSVWRYAHNVTVENCTFTAVEGSAAQNNFVGVKVQQNYNITVKNCVGTNLHSLLNAESCGNPANSTNESYIVVDGCEVVNGKSGVSFNNTANAIIKNTTIESVVDGGYGIRHKGAVANYSLTVENCEISAFVPVLIRNMTASGYTATFNGTNSLTATNSFGYEVVLSAKDWDDDSALPTSPTGSYTLTGADDFVVFEGVTIEEWTELQPVTTDTTCKNMVADDYVEICHKSGNLTLEYVTFKNGLTIYTNEIENNGTVTLKNCTIYLSNGISANSSYNQCKADYGLNLNLANGSDITFVFENCTFTAADGHTYSGNSGYNVYIGGGYSANSITFTGCTFEKSAKHAIGCSSEGSSQYYTLSVTDCNFKDWNNNATNGAAIRGNLPATDFAANIIISGNTYGDSNDSTQATVAIDSWTGTWN